MERRKPLRRTPLKRGQSSLKRSRIKPKRKKNPMPVGRYEQVLRRDGGCVAGRYGLRHVCSGNVEVHHIRGRGMGGSADRSIHDLDNLLCLCSTAHRWVTEHPAEAERMGLIERRLA